MGIDAEHLAEDGLASLHEVLREAAALADPIRARLRQRGAEGRVVGVRHPGRIGGEDGGVVDLAVDVSLDEGEVFIGGNLNGLVPRVEPGKGVVA